jgi:hypothetical protein
MPLPAKLYKYQAYTHYSVDGLRNSTLFFRAPAKFNDPYDSAQPIVRPLLSQEELTMVFEVVARAPGAPRCKLEAQLIKDGQFTEHFGLVARERLKHELEEQIERQRNQRGVTCFAESYTDLLMWAHYANGHRGFCLEFDTRAEFFSKAIQVIYSTDFPQLGPREIFDKDPTALVQALIAAKSVCWSYEQEWRVGHVEPGKNYGYGDALTGIYLGAVMPEEDVSVIRELFRNTPTRVYRMILSTTSFSVSAVPLE